MSTMASTRGIIAYAAPVTGGYFFYIPMWSILPGIYAKYFGLPLTSIAAVVLFAGYGAGCAIKQLSC